MSTTQDRRAPLFPPETIGAILDEVAADDNCRVANDTLFCSALVSKEWKDLACERLYLHIRLKGSKRRTMEALAQSGALVRYRTKSLSFEEVTSWSRWSQLLDGCVEVEKLSLRRAECDQAGVTDVPLGFLQHPALASLKSLTLIHCLETDPHFQDSVVAPVHFQLQELITDLRFSYKPFLRGIARAAFRDGSSSLTRVRLSPPPSPLDPLQHIPEAINCFMSVSDFIRELSIPDHSDHTMHMPVLLLLRACSSLTRLQITCGDDILSPAMVGTYFGNIPHLTKLESLEFGISPDKYSPELLQMLTKAIVKEEVLSALEEMRFPSMPVADLQGFAGWRHLRLKLNKRNVRIVTKEDL